MHQCLDFRSDDIPGSEEMTSIMGAGNYTDNDGCLPIRLAVSTCRTEVLKMITDANPAKFSSNHPEWGTVAHMAVSGHNILYIHRLMSQLLLSLDGNKRPPLAVAAYSLKR